MEALLDSKHLLVSSTCSIRAFKMGVTPAAQPHGCACRVVLLRFLTLAWRMNTRLSLQFSEFVIANVRLYALRNERRLSTHAVAHFTRRELATALRRVRSCPSLSLCDAPRRTRHL